MTLQKCFVILLFLYVGSIVESHKILVVCPAPSKSHNILCKGIVDVLVDDGHEVTFMTAFPSKNKKVKDVVIKDMFNFNPDNFPSFSDKDQSAWTKVMQIYTLVEDIFSMFYEDKETIKLLNDKSQKFDLVIFEYFMTDALAGIGVRFDCPTAAFTSLSPMSWLTTLTRNPLSIATVPDVLTGFSNIMSLKERVINTLVIIMQDIIGATLIQPLQKRAYEKYMPEEAERVPYEELRNRISFLFTNTHPSIGAARPFLPNTVEIGGFHITEPEPLPRDLKEIIDSAKDGVIYFSMGSMLKSSELDAETRKAILNTFSKLKQTVLWKFEEELPEKPNNVIIRDWMPQSSILAHPNVRLFISHGGLLSCTETTYFGVPLLAIPVFGDQNHNAKSIADRKQGIVLSIMNITEESFTWSINEMLNNPIYSKTAKNVKDVFHDRPVKPRELLAYYANHLIRTNGAKHLSPPPISRCSDLLLDVAAVIIIPIVIVLFIAIFACKKLCFKSKKEKSVDAKKKHN